MYTLSSSHLKRDFPPYPLLPYAAHVSYAYHARGIDRPGGAAISKTRFLSAAGHHVDLIRFRHSGRGAVATTPIDYRFRTGPKRPCGWYTGGG